MKYEWFVVCSLWLVVGLPKLQQVSPSDIRSASAHPFYISVTEINHNAKDKTMEVSCKMFADDLEQVLEKNYKTQLDISLEKDKAKFDQYIADYVSKHLALSIDGKPVKLSYVGFEKDKESVFCYFQADNIPTPKKITVANTLLYDFNDAEMNIIHVIVNGNRQSKKLNAPEKEVMFEF